MKEVELFHAWEWICDECGKNNFASSVTLSVEEAEDMGIEVIMPEIPEGKTKEDGNFIVFSEPEEVKCENCGAEFKTVENYER